MKIFTLTPASDLDVRSVAINDAIDDVFKVDVIARSPNETIDLDALIGKPLALDQHAAGSVRRWSGVCAAASQTRVPSSAVDAGLATYALTIAPHIWLLTQRTNHRTLRGLSAPEIAATLLSEWGIEPVVRLQGSHPRLPATTQLGETDYDFVRRVLADAGIAFFHDISDRDARLVLTDAPQAAPAADRVSVPFIANASLDASKAKRGPFVSDVGIRARVAPTCAVVRDYDFRRPGFDLAGYHGPAAREAIPALELHRYLPGETLVEAKDPATREPVADASGVYRHREHEATARARRIVEAHTAHATTVSFSTSSTELLPGVVFSMTGHPHPVVADGAPLLVTRSSAHADAFGAWHASGDAVSARVPYRPLDADSGVEASCSGQSHRDAAPARPRVDGVQMASVVGPIPDARTPVASAGDVHPDEHGRIDLRFPWSRDGASSGFARVSQAWAGAGHGVQAIPRVGHQVVAAFTNGNADHPVVLASTHTTTAPTPYRVPDDATRTVILTNASSGGNELTFDDAAGKELLYEQAAEDLHKVVKHDEIEQTDGARSIHVDGDLLITVGGMVTLSGKELTAHGGPNIKVNPAAPPPTAKKPKSLDTSSLNALLMTMKPDASFSGESDAAAAEYKSDAERYQKDAILLGKKWHVPPALILALMNRETRFGHLLVDGWGDQHHGFGILQVDNRSATPVGGPYSLEHMNQAMSIFAGKEAEIRAAHPSWTKPQQLAGATAAYNAGASGIVTQPTSPSTWQSMDQGTYADYPGSGGDYSRDTWEMARWYAQNLKW